MAALFRVFWQIAMLRAGPQVLPASRELLWLLLVAQWLFDTMLLAAFAFPPDRAVLSSLVGTLIMVAVVHGLLIMHRHHNRVTQTLSAMAGCGVMLNLLTLPLLVMYQIEGEMKALASILQLLLLGWNIAIVAHIFRHALGVTIGIGLLFAIGYILISFSLSSFLVPAEVPV